MTDIVDKKTRSRMMSGIRGKDTKPEIKIRKALFSRGFRYRLHDSKLPGKPDIVLAKYRAVILVNGCFWHLHEGCPLFRWPASRTEFWKEKLQANRERDLRNLTLMQNQGWRTIVVWECAIKGKQRLPFEIVIDNIGEWLTNSEAMHKEIFAPFDDASG